MPNELYEDADTEVETEDSFVEEEEVEQEEEFEEDSEDSPAQVGPTNEETNLKLLELVDRIGTQFQPTAQPAQPGVSAPQQNNQPAYNPNWVPPLDRPEVKARLQEIGDRLHWDPAAGVELATLQAEMQQETLNHHHAENRIRADGQAARQRLGTLAKQKYGDLVDDADIREQEDWIFREVFQGNEVLYYTAINTPAMQEMVARLAVGARAAKAKGQPRTQGAASARRPASGNQAAPPVRAKAPSNWWEDPAELAAAAFAGTRGNPAKKGGKR